MPESRAEQVALQHRKLEADIAQGNAAADQATAACSVQDDFDVEVNQSSDSIASIDL